MWAEQPNWSDAELKAIDTPDWGISVSGPRVMKPLRRVAAFGATIPIVRL
jgi:hypothetical protein